MSIPKSDIIVLRDYFKYLPGQTLKEFKNEIDALTSEEKKELADLARIELNKFADELLSALNK